MWERYILKIILFGASLYGKEIFDFFKKYAPQVKISFFLDNDKHKKDFLGFPVKHLDQVVLKQDESVVIVTSQYYEEIKKQLIEKGLRENIDFFSGELLLRMARELKLVEQKIQQLHADNIKYRIVTKQDLKVKKTSDTIFLLGSGSSINDITNEQWEHIKKHDSWGFNYWPVHDFIPTFYSFEIPNKKSKYHLYNFIWNYQFRKNLKREFEISFIKDVKAYDGGELDDLQKNVDIIPVVKDVNIPCADYNSLKNALYLMNSLNLWDSIIFFKLASSIAMLINMSVTMGYKNIVLCGIDLKDNKYFFKEDKKYYKNPNLKFDRCDKKNDSDQLHITMRNDYGSLKADVIIKMLNEYLLKPRGVNLYVFNSYSALYPDIELYKI